MTGKQKMISDAIVIIIWTICVIAYVLISDEPLIDIVISMAIGMGIGSALFYGIRFCVKKLIK